jgi:hypothetical protein
MKISYTFRLFTILLVSLMALQSCSSNFSTFSKRQYNTGFAKYKKSDKKDHTETLSKKESKEAIVEETVALAETKDYVASTEAIVEETNIDANYVKQLVIDNFASTKTALLEEKANAKTEKEVKEAEKALAKMQKIENMLNKYAPKIAEKAAIASNPPAPGKSRAEKMGLAALIMGAAGLFFGFLAVNIAAVIVGKRAMEQSSYGSSAYTQGKIGRILGWVGIGLFLLFFLIFLLVVLAAF